MRASVGAAAWLGAAVLLATAAGCGRGGGPKRIEVPELGLSMSIPAGWQLDHRNPRMCAKGDATGLVLDQPWSGDDFAAHVDHLCEEFGGVVLSKTSLEIDACPAIRAVIHYPDQGTKALKLYIRKGDRLIEVSFVTPIEDFAGHESGLRESLASIRLR